MNASVSSETGDDDKQGLVPSVVRAFAVLELLGKRPNATSLAQLTSELALPKSSVRTISNTMATLGYVRRDPDGGYRLGPRIVGLAQTFLSNTDVVHEFNALCLEKDDAKDETLLLSILSGTDALYLAVRNSVRPLGLAFNVGLRFPAYQSASGKAMLAYLPVDDAIECIKGGLHAVNGKPCDVPNGLVDELDLTRRRGYSIDNQGIREGVYAFGAPVFDSVGQICAAVSVCITTATLEKDRSNHHLHVAVQVAREITARLGGQVPT